MTDTNSTGHQGSRAFFFLILFLVYSFHVFHIQIQERSRFVYSWQLSVTPTLLHRNCACQLGEWVAEPCASAVGLRLLVWPILGAGGCFGRGWFLLLIGYKSGMHPLNKMISQQISPRFCIIAVHQKLFKKIS